MIKFLTTLEECVDALRADSLFKYTHKRYVRDILRHGKFRITTVSECRRLEEKKLIGDHREGLQPTEQHIDYWHSQGGVALPRNFDQAIQLRGRNNVIQNCSVEGEFSSGERYLLCLSSERSKDLMTRLGYNACIQIENIHRFVSAVNREIELRGKFVGAGRVLYYDEEEVKASPWHLQELHPLQIKRPPYRFQNEVRIVWRPLAPPISPFFVHSTELARCCRRVRF